MSIFQHQDRFSIIQITGEEAKDFLQGLISCDMKRLTEDQALYGALLTPQGKFTADFFITLARDEEGSLYLITAQSFAADLFKKLRMYKLRKAVDLSLREDLKLASSKAELTQLDAIALVSFNDPRLNDFAQHYIISAEQTFTEPSEDWNLHLLEAGLPNSETDLELQKSTLLEANFDLLNGVHFDKGCYIGQELTARMHYRGLLKKRLVPFTLEADVRIDLPATISNEAGKKVGTLTSIQKSIGLGLIRLDALDGVLTVEGTPLTVRAVAWLPEDRLTPPEKIKMD